MAFFLDVLVQAPIDRTFNLDKTMSGHSIFFRFLLTLLLCLSLCAPASLQAQDTITADLSSHLGGIVSDVVAQDGFAYVGQAVALHVYDLSTTPPTDAAILTFTASSPAAEISGLLLDGNRLYVGRGDAIAVVDVTDPTSPTILGEASLGNTRTLIDALARSGTVLYASQRAFDATAVDGLSVFDISDETAPALIRTLDDHPATDVAIHGHHLYAVTGEDNTSRLRVFDLTDPTNPAEVASLPVGSATRVETADGLALVSGGAGEGTLLFDLADPDDPVLLSTFTNGQAPMRTVVTDGTTAFIEQFRAVLIVDITDPAEPTLLGTSEAGLPFIQSLAPFTAPGKRQATHLLVGGGNLVVMDVSDPATPVANPPVPMPDVANHIAVAPNADLFIASLESTFHFTHTEAGLLVLAGVFDETAASMAADNTFLYRWGLNGNLEIFDVTRPTPTARGTLPGTLFINDTVLDGTTLYGVSRDGQVLLVVDVSNPDAPALLDTFSLAAPGHTLALDAGQGLLYVGELNGGSGSGNIEVLDVTNPANPASVHEETVNGVPRALFVADGVLYATTNVDLFDPLGWSLQAFTSAATPTLLAELSDQEGRISDLTVLDDVILAGFPSDNEVRAFALEDEAGKRLAQLNLRGIGAFTSPLPELLVGLGLNELRVLYLSGGFYSLGHMSLSKGVFGYEIEGLSPDSSGRGLTPRVVPGLALNEGCQTNPTNGTTVDHPAGASGTPINVVITADCANNGWNFFQWTGTTSFNPLVAAPTVPFKGENEEMDANFKLATLTLSALPSLSVEECPTDVEGTKLSMGEILLTANALPVPLSKADWELNGLTLRPEGNLLAREVDKILVEVLGREPIELSPDSTGNGLLAPIVLSNLSVEIPEASSVSIEVFYVIKEGAFRGCPLKAADGTIPADEDRFFSLKVNTADIRAEEANLFNGVIVPKGGSFSLDEKVLACVHNKTSLLVGNLIQHVVKDPDTQAGHLIQVCPCTYEENIDFEDANLTLQSIAGPAQTTIQANPDSAAVTIDEPGGTLSGFTITGGLNGVDVEASNVVIGAPSTGGKRDRKNDDDKARTIIADNQGDGIFILTVPGESEVENVSVVDNYIGLGADGITRRKNIGSGVRIENASRNEVAFNHIAGNGDDGVTIRTARDGKAEDNDISFNYIGLAADSTTRVQNDGDGVAIIEASKNQVAANTISGNSRHGVFIRRGASANVVSVNRIGLEHPNEEDGIRIEEASNNEIRGNTISENDGHGVTIIATQREATAEENIISLNRIGLAEDGLAAAGNAGHGVLIQDASNNLLALNTISANDSIGVLIVTTATDRLAEKNKLFKNIIGLALDGQTRRGNGLDGVLIQDASDNTVLDNTLSANTLSGVALITTVAGRKTERNVIEANRIGTGLSSNEADSLLHNNENGVTIQGLDNARVRKSLIKANLIANHQNPLGSSGIAVEFADNTEITRNFIKNNKVGLFLLAVENGFVAGNLMANNGTCGLFEASTGLGISNGARQCSETATGFHLIDSNFDLIGNDFAGNAGAGVWLEGTSTATLTRNNFSSHPDFAVRNDTGTPLAAQGNFWGAADGPSGQGPGSGDAVTGEVDFSNFLDAPVSLVLATQPSLVVTTGTTDSISVLLSNHVSPNGLVEVTLGDELGWLTGPTAFTVTLADSLSEEMFAHVAVPAGLPLGTENTLTITATAATGTDATTVRLITGDPTTVGLENEATNDALPQTFALHPNYPNPFNPSTAIRYELPMPGRVTLAVYDMLGRHIATLVDGLKSTGQHTAIWDAAHLSSGLYLVRMQAEGPSGQRFSAVIKTLLLK